MNHDSPAPSSIAAGLASTPEDRAAAYSLRYRVYVAEQGKPYPEADHANGWLADALDESAELLVVKRNGVVCGTVRGNRLPCEAVNRQYGEVFGFDRFAGFPASAMSVCSRLALAPEVRDSAARCALFDAIYRLGLALGTQLCFMACAPRLVRLFTSYGFRAYAQPFADTHVGELVRMVLVLDDVDYLRRVKSPFARIDNVEKGLQHAAVAA